MLDLTQKEIRHEYMVARLRMDIAYQVRLLRLQREWTQEQLAEKCQTEQSAISEIENWNAQFPTVKTLKRIAKVFDCGLIIRFTGWEEIINSIVPDYNNDQIDQNT